MSFINTYTSTSTTNVDINPFLNMANCHNEIIKKWIMENKSFSINSHCPNDPNKYTLLHMAIISKNYDLIEFLLNISKIDIEKLNTYNQSCKTLAFETGDIKIIKLFITHMMKQTDNNLKQLQNDINYYRSELKRVNEKTIVLKEANDTILSENTRLSKQINEEKRKSYRTDTMLNLERKRKRSLETEVTSLNEKNKKLKKSIETLSDSLRK